MAYEDYQRIRKARRRDDDVRVVIVRAKLAVDVAVGGQTRDVELGELPASPGPASRRRG